MLAACRPLSLFLLAVMTAAASLAGLSRPPLSRSGPQHVTQEVLYLPNGHALQLMSFGYRNALAQVLWFNTINYFGKHYRGDKNYRWLNHMCALVTDLHTRAKDYYQFCGAMLAWEAEMPQQAAEILSKGIRHIPQDWLLFYQRGFIYIFFLNDEDRARADFMQASKLPDADPIVASLASKKLLSSGSPEEAISFLSELINSTTDSSAKSVYQSRLMDAVYEAQLRKLEQAAADFSERFGRTAASIDELEAANLVPPELRHSGYRDPFGGRYYIDAATSQIESSSKRRRPALYWKKEKTG